MRRQKTTIDVTVDGVAARTQVVDVSLVLDTRTRYGAQCTNCMYRSRTTDRLWVAMRDAEQHLELHRFPRRESLTRDQTILKSRPGDGCWLVPDRQGSYTVHNNTMKRGAPC